MTAVNCVIIGIHSKVKRENAYTLNDWQSFVVPIMFS